jgi:hypothetical protein
MMQLCAFCAILRRQRQQSCRRRHARIVIALKRNGAYAGDIQVQQLGWAELFESRVNRRT